MTVRKKKISLLNILNSRLGWDKLFSHKIPKHANNITYLLGGLTLVGIIIQGITGLILMQFYHPHPEIPGAYESIQFMMEQALVALVRSVHYWTSQVLILTVILHLIRVFIAGAYKRPRELQWLAGVGLLFLTFALAFTGTVLKWDQESVEALEHNVELAEGLGALGYWFLPQFAAGVPLLVRLYAAHVTLIPVLGLLVLGLHLFLIRVLGISGPKKRIGGRIEGLEETMVPFSSHVWRMLGYGGVMTLVIVLVSIALPAPLGMRAVEGIEVTKPPWFLLFVVGVEDLLGLAVVPYLIGILSISLLAVPLLDRSDVTNPRQRKIVITAMFALLAVILLLMVYAAVSLPEVHLG